MESFPTVEIGRITDKLIGLGLTVIAHENHRLEAPESLAQEAHRTILEPAQNGILPFGSKLVEGTAVASEGRPPQHAEEDCELSPHRCRSVLERLIDDAEEAALNPAASSSVVSGTMRAASSWRNSAFSWDRDFMQVVYIRPPQQEPVPVSVSVSVPGFHVYISFEVQFGHGYGYGHGYG
jgi:hypothetical protein